MTVDQAQAVMQPALLDIVPTRTVYATVYGEALPGGHWLPEECPRQVSATLLDFLP